MAENEISNHEKQTEEKLLNIFTTLKNESIYRSALSNKITEIAFISAIFCNRVGFQRKYANFERFLYSFEYQFVADIP
ncbi:MAG: hypothetical protein LKG25_03235 [Prevotella sp.]|jgi:hypothetical protein|nr:hypothetical protein [Prevotella sp.]MCI1281592.1 hypothetical protein [Prevotella sp.]